MGIEKLHWVDNLLNDGDERECIDLVYLVAGLDPYEQNSAGRNVYSPDEMRIITKFQTWTKRHSRDSRD